MSADVIDVLTTEVVVIPRPQTAAIGGGFKRRTQFATILCYVETASGIVGESYISFESVRQAEGLASVISDAARVLRGMDPLARRSARRLVAREIHDILPGSGAAQVLLSVIDLALYDVLGKITGLPIWRLAGGDGSAVKCYASHGLFGGESEEELVLSARRLVDAGFDGVKLRVGRRPVREDVARTRVVRQALGPHVALMVDGLWSMPVGDAVRYGRSVEELDIAWFEDPTMEGNVTSLKEVRNGVGVPIASGERISNVGQFAALLAADAIDVAIVDVYHIGGASPWLRCAELAGDRGIPIAGHAAPAYSAQLVSAVENGHTTEYFPWWDDLQGGALKPENGVMSMPAEPGWGMPFDRDAIRAYRAELERNGQGDEAAS